MTDAFQIWSYLASQPLLLTGSTVHRLRVNGRRSVDQAVAALGADA